MKTRNVAISSIFLTILFGWFVATIYIEEFLPSIEPIFFGIYFEQIVGMLLGFIIGIVIATFIVRATFLEKIRHETFSFIGLSLALFTFALNVIVPRFIPSMLVQPYVLPTGETVPPSDSILLTLSLVIGVILSIIIFAITYHIAFTKK